MAIIIEQLNEDGKVNCRHTIRSGSVTLGRSYDNDIVIDDPYVCPLHVTIAIHEGNITLSDKNSINGTIVSNKVVTDETTIRNRDIILMGKTRLRIINTQAPLPATLTLNKQTNMQLWAAKFSTLVSLSLILLSYLMYTLYLEIGTTDKLMLSKVIAPALLMTGALVIWPLFMSLMATIRRNPPKIKEQINSTLAVVTAVIFVEAIVSFLHFNFNLGQLRTYFQWGLESIALYVLISLNIFFAFKLSKTYRRIISVTFSLSLIAVLSLFEHSQAPSFNSKPVYNVELFSPFFNVELNQNAEQFIEQQNQLFEKAQRLTNATDEDSQ